MRLHGDDGDKQVPMELYEKEVEMFPDIHNMESADDAADSCYELLFDANEYM